MTCVRICGWETQDISEAGSSGGTVSISTSIKRTGQASARSNPTTTGTGSVNVTGVGATGINTAFNLATSYTRFYFRYDTKPASNDEEFYNCNNTRGIKLSLRLNSSGNIVAYDTTPTIITTGATVLASGTWYRIEVKCGTGTSAAWEIKVDGTVEISGTNNLNAANMSSNNFGKQNNRNSQTVDFYYDDVNISDSGYPGSGQIEVMQPDANGNYQNWSIGAGSGSHYQQVDELPSDGDTTYLVSAININAETEALESGASAGITGTVNVVQSFVVVKRDNAAGNGSVKLRTRSGSTDSDASTYASTSSYVLLSKIFETDPATSAAWVLSALDSVEVGCLHDTMTVLNTRMTVAGVMVDFVPAASTDSKMLLMF